MKKCVVKVLKPVKKKKIKRYTIDTILVSISNIRIYTHDDDGFDADNAYLCFIVK